MPITAREPYDDQNVFAKILRGEIPSRTIYDDEYAAAFHDIGAQAPVHVLVIPKGRYVSFVDFSARAPDAEITGFVRAVGRVATLLGLDEPGFRILANHGLHAGQEVGHFHVHILAGRPLGGALLAP